MADVGMERDETETSAAPAQHSWLTTEQLQALTGPLHPDRVATRKQGGATLSYLEGWDVKATLIRVFGFGGFSAEVTEAKVIWSETYPSSDGKKSLHRVAAQVTVRLTIHPESARDSHWPTYTEAAISEQSSPSFGEAADFAIKTAETDALKRAAIYLGTQFGLSLYDSGSLKDVVRVVMEPIQKAALEPVMQARRDALAKGKANMDRMLGQVSEQGSS